MLVLSRQRDETIMIGDDIELTVVDIRGDKVRLGIKAPSHVAVHRKEIYDAIKRENEQAACLKQNELSALRPPGSNPIHKVRPLGSATRISPPRDQPNQKRESA
ncbi:MAG TPA: carbon storage regulator CsrA [Phycisphaerales bacterium]|jgi:carbon storage regulator|nr:carbon storage regulator CsrA [Phycisphaerales bacterium]